MRALVLAAGKGTRMKSKIPKVLHPLSGKPMIEWVVETAGKVAQKVGVVLGFEAELVRKTLPEWVDVFVQEEQLGTAHAVMCAKDFIEPGDDVLILYGDVPLISENTLKRMIEEHRKGADVTILVADLEDPSGYGRVIQDGDKYRIIEDADLPEELKSVTTINTGFYVFSGDFLLRVLPEIKNENAKGEYYLTDAVNFAEKVRVVKTDDLLEITGVNTRKTLVWLEEQLRMRKIEELLENGVTILDPATTYIHYSVEIGMDTVIHPMTFIEGRTRVGENCEIGPMTRIVDCEIGNNVKITRSECFKSVIEDDVSVGPFARLREGTILKKSSKIGNFVEIKKSTIGEGTKAQHLSYIGDAFVGKNVNIGAGTITCNYDGKKKNPTFIEDGAFIGSNSSLVAPVRIGEGALIGAGSVITEDVPPYSLGLGRARQVVKEGWVLKKRKEE
ncbi:glucosamine-1-phosphate N-acetyltransferase / UDP-N-acetylglucosamine pyrophosphorylase [Thermotoga petrophila RKU-1]|uniref:Bifunctional protein GlmU n=1 Tax=Thermotoga petrophila (strain ATCC BAA-488 / DSM 13995 / JCM 10881 / RKU-1) TaxID=390874 RepID=GLMU_THEP1|nr:bifunctional UDP-N-acetylglucosamine diphosphorylase/glucosamine-1-phosphate N-acetyltransferase GlmU [Thermotoga petrophila]A5ILV3.1 RecName: Full=Bifunctional protein GlmU; Includes: RecName: Full=UDP-N-acetylglucosamine pyrophosphorylase; AltName: Full=N-acetylglucosamine-1-phosphate uridyltransferase; Includes: RecName: Full=Glucosamine-1-phosphate N-acetyltransferase [Thermotoga petrophila RKU-1]ABQ47176.1 glucosamine-1-phosphate N-acetyltransferase / UDP-N-acetylglucosamine pyrophosphory